MKDCILFQDGEINSESPKKNILLCNAIPVGFPHKLLYTFLVKPFSFFLYTNYDKMLAFYMTSVNINAPATALLMPKFLGKLLYTTEY